MAKHPDFKQKPRLIGKKIMLRPFQLTDGELMIPLLNEPEVKIMTGSANTTIEAEKVMTNQEELVVKKWYEERNWQTDRLDLAIESIETSQLVGEVVLNEWDSVCQSCNYRIFIGKSGRQKGYGSEATQLFLTYAFEVLGVHRIELEVFASNPRARHVYQKSGFSYEGTKRQAGIYGGKWLDIDLYGMLATDYFKL